MILDICIFKTIEITELYSMIDNSSQQTDHYKVSYGLSDPFIRIHGICPRISPAYQSISSSKEAFSGGSTFPTERLCTQVSFSTGRGIAFTASFRYKFLCPFWLRSTAICGFVHLLRCMKSCPEFIRSSNSVPLYFAISLCQTFQLYCHSFPDCRHCHSGAHPEYTENPAFHFPDRISYTLRIVSQQLTRTSSLIFPVAMHSFQQVFFQIHRYSDEKPDLPGQSHPAYG